MEVGYKEWLDKCGVLGVPGYECFGSLSSEEAINSWWRGQLLAGAHKGMKMGLEERLKGSAGEELGRLSVCAKRPNPRV